VELYLALLAQSEVASGFNVADNALMNGFVGNSQAGFKIYMSNNLPTSVVLTVDTQPTAGDKVTIAGVTLTCVADGTAATEGQINIGADLADFKLILVDALNQGTSKTADWVLAADGENRRKLQNANVVASAFATNDCTITAAGKIGGTETFTAVTNIFGTETGSLLCGDIGAISLGMQIQPTMASAPVPTRPMETNYAIHTLYGKKVFHRDAPRLVNLTINV